MMRLLLAVCLLFAVAVQARVEVLEFSSPEQEARYTALIAELRCLVCQNQNLADSDADLAKDLRAQTYEMIRQGASDDQIVDYMVDRYGDFVLYRPPFKATTLLLWLGPFIILLAGVAIVVTFVRRQRRVVGPDLSEADHEAARRLLQEPATKPDPRDA